MRSCWLVVGLVSLLGCEKAKPPYDGPMPIAFGDCAGPQVAWISGPQPEAFTAALADAVRVASVSPARATPPPPPDAGVAADADVVALDEGKMGKRDEGQYRMQRNTDPQLARQQVIEQARTAGILGTTALEQGGAFASLTGTDGVSSGFDDGNIYGGLLGSAGDAPNGGFGFGRSGFGPGGGSPGGWGTIGTGHYGTIGHGSHIDRSPDLPYVAVGQPVATGALDKAIIRRYIKRNIQKITYCYEKQLLTKPKLAGTLTAQFVIAPSGSVTSASATGFDPTVASCVTDVIKGIEFPKPKDSAGVQVTYPFTFRPGSETPAAGAGSGADAAGSGAGSGSDQAAPAPVPVPAVAATGDTPAHVTRTLYRIASTDGRNYEPGAANPLRTERAALTDCVRKNVQHYGAIVVELGGPDVIVHGLDGEARDCVAAVAKRVPGAVAQRCSLAFGVMPASALPALDVTAEALTLDGKSLGAPRGDDATIPALVTAITARVDAALAPAAPVVALYGPLAVRPLDATPMKVVTRVLRSIVAGGDDFVLAARRDNVWKPLPAIALPVAPVPLGTGGRWSRLARPPTNMFAMSDDDHVTLSILITKQQIWIGVSRVNDFQQIVHDATQPQKLAAALAAQKASAFFADRTDLEIAADDDLSYGEVVPVIDAAITAGFADWRITDPQALAARPSL